MKKIFLLLAFFNTFIFAKSILILNSYHKGYEFSDSIINSMEKQFYKNHKYDVNILYMDAKRITSKEYFSNLKNLYKVQLENIKFDLVITVDRFAYDFVLKNYNSMFKDIPVLTLGIENFNKQKALNNELKKVSALIERRDLLGNISFIEKAIPSMKQLYIINDISANAKHTEPLIQEALKAHKNKDYELIYYRAKNLEELKAKFSKKQKNTAILFIRFYKNKDGHLNKNQEISDFIKNSKVPVFVTDSIFVKKGAFGGKIVDLEDFGLKGFSLAKDILEKNIYSIEAFKDFKYIFDEQKIKEFLIFPNVLISDYELVNKGISFYEKYSKLIGFVFATSPFLILLIIGLARNIILRRRVEKDLRQRIEFDSLLLNAIESPIFWQDENGKLIDSNARFCNFIKLSSKDIYGHCLHEFKSNDNVLTIIRVLEKYKKDKSLNSQFTIKTSSNEKKTYFIKQASYCDSKTKKAGTVTIFTDITKEKEIQKERQKNQQFIIQQSKLAEIGEIFSSIAHQWKSPLVEITTIAQESFYNSNSSLSEDESYVKDIMTQVDYMNNTINDFQKFIMPSSKKKIFNAKEAIDSILQIVEHNIKYNYINVNIHVKDNINVNVYGFRNEFMQSFLNIINNAKDQLLKNDLKNRNIDICFSNKNETLNIEVKDNAGGIKQDSLKKIFKAYYSTKKDGHGIGLYMAKMIIEDKMNGKLNARNIQNGACFEISLKSVK